MGHGKPETAVKNKSVFASLSSGKEDSFFFEKKKQEIFNSWVRT